MSREHHPSRSEPEAVPSFDGFPRGPPGASDYWQGLISEKPAADFLDLSTRSLQGFRYRGGGPKFIRISARCVKYRRIDLQQWVEARLRSSTFDAGPEGA